MHRLVLLAVLAFISIPVFAAGASELQPLAVIGREGTHVFQVEIADENAERLKGLQGRETLPSDQGMLFLFESCRPLSFWMKNTPLSLDMAFLDRNGEILDIAANTEPYSLESIGPPGDAFAVLEVGAGELAARGIVIGDRVGHPALRGAPCE